MDATPRGGEVLHRAASLLGKERRAPCSFSEPLVASGDRGRKPALGDRHLRLTQQQPNHRPHKQQTNQSSRMREREREVERGGRSGGREANYHGSAAPGFPILGPIQVRGSRRCTHHWPSPRRACQRLHVVPAQGCLVHLWLRDIKRVHVQTSSLLSEPHPLATRITLSGCYPNCRIPPPKFRSRWRCNSPPKFSSRWRCQINTQWLVSDLHHKNQQKRRYRGQRKTHTSITGASNSYASICLPVAGCAVRHRPPRCVLSDVCSSSVASPP